MKITEMLQREDFYNINKATLCEYYGNNTGGEKLYIYPNLNAIVTKKPSKKVMEYLLTEYDIRNNPIKKLIVKIYVLLCIYSGGIFSSQTVDIPNNSNPHTLIYPCNRKYRIFDFSSNTVDVQIKSGFSTEQLLHEIEFRAKPLLPDFVPELISHNTTGYKERIIDGRPLARISEGYEKYKKRAYEEFFSFSLSTAEEKSGVAYASKLRIDFSSFNINCNTLINDLTKIIEKIPYVTLVFSHGDLQAGNIWVENGTNKIFIIDWESWETRSSFYDKAVLFDSLRPADISEYLKKDIPLEEKAIVLTEDLLFRLNEYKSLPGEFGKEKLDDYIKKLSDWVESIK